MNRRSRLYLSAALLLALVLIGLGTAANAQQPNGTASQSGVVAQKDPTKLTPDLRQQFAAQAPGAQVKYWVVLKDQADTSNNIPTAQWADKGWYVYNTLRAKAAATQGSLLAQLNSMKAAGQVGEITSYWIVNSIIASGDLASAETMATNPAVAIVKEMSTYQIFDTPATLSDAALDVYNQARLDSVGQSHWNVPFLIQHNQNEVHAPQAWALGYDGTGVTVGSMDTGSRWTHEALSARYRGNVAPPDPSNIHDYNWLDGYGTYTVPTDNNGHGSHTMGTIVGTSPNATYGNIGTAPGAMWMTVRICATSSCDLQPILNGFQWTLAPYRVNGTQPNPAYRPRVSSNSWGNSTCNTPDFQAGVTAWVNAGIFPDFATGNSGPGAGTVGAPASYVNAWGSGNLNTSIANWVIAVSSSRGPSCYDQSIRPQAIAPGTNICSSINTSDTSYSCSYTGTSMATPHIAGALAILQQKNPNLTIPQYMYALTSTAFFSPTWGTRPNNNYGWGLIQIDDALNSIPSQGTPTPTATDTPLPTATPGPATDTPTALPTSAATATATVTAVPTSCPVQFNDVAVGSTFYDFIRCLACRGIVGGYPCGGPGEPCPGAYYRPNNNVTRGQVSKIVSESAAFADPVPSTQQTFEDVAPASTFWLWIERLSSRGIIGGYPCGGPFEPCVSPTNRPYFRPGNDVTRGQLSKIVSGAAGWTETPTGQTFADVAPGSTFYLYIERIASRGIVNGYPCGGVGEPCVAPDNRPYFRPFNNATRGQMSKIAAAAFFPGCSTPAQKR